MSVRHILFCAMLCFAGFTSIAQTAYQYVARGDKELMDGYPESALFYYRLALKSDTQLVEAHFKTGEAYRAQRNYKKAEKYYASCAKLDEQDYFPEALFWLGKMQQQQGDYKTAKRSIQSFLSVYRKRDDFYRSARDTEESCDWALGHLGDDPSFTVSRPDSGLNTIHAEMSPYLWDSNTLYFATMRYETDFVKKNDPVFVEMKKAVKDSLRWNLTELGLPISDENAHVGNGCFSPDSLRFYYSNCPTPSECAVFVIRMENGVWGTPEKLESPVNENGSITTQPMIAAFDGDEFLFFASDRNSGKGGMDLWYVEVKNGKPLTRLRNLGTRVNTPGNEITPWFDQSDTMFYFSSDRQLGFGGFDVYKSKGGPGSFNTVENAGTEVNSPADDYYFAFKKQDRLGYFASNRVTGLKKSGNETCCNDLYKVHLIVPVDSTPMIAVADTIDSTTALVDTLVIPKTIEQLQDLLPISLYFHNDRPNPRSMATTTERDYAQTIQEYMSLKDEYITNIAASNRTDSSKSAMTERTLGFFSEDLTGSIKRVNAALDVLLKELQDSGSIKIAVKGYASPLANSDYNLNLTYRRIDAMENYIRRYADGAFVPFLDTPEKAGGQLVIEKIPYGESKASKSISDQSSDKVAAIYSPEAARERRIEILRVERK